MVSDMATPAARVGRHLSSAWYSLIRNIRYLLQVALAVGLVYHYEIEGTALLVVLSLAAVGFAITIVSPRAYRLPLFLAVSLSGIFIVLGLRDGVWLIVLGMLLIGACHLPLKGIYRVLALVFIGGALAVARDSWDGSPWSSALWPILGSMFMFRLILYVRATSFARANSGFWTTMAYFFMLPNLAFPLFPVVDYDGFRRSHLSMDELSMDESEVYERGILFICRGLVHLILYRLIYANFIDDPTEIMSLGDLVQFVVGTYLLYLRVSGHFHLAIGILHLFGFALPATNRMYFLSSGFTDMWRRMNIYWTEFMTKVVFYPTYFRLKRLGQVSAIVVSTAVVFFATWFLHSYQWFWLRGGFPLRLQDALFWGVLGVLVTRGVLKEIGTSQPAKSPLRWSWKPGLKAAATFFTISFLWSLWSAPTFADWVWMLSAVVNVDLKGIVLILVILLIISIMASLERAQLGTMPRWIEVALTARGVTIASLTVLLILAQPATWRVVPSPAAEVLKSIQTAKVNPRDNIVQSRGYYERLDVKRADHDAGVGDTVQIFEKLRHVANNECTEFVLQRTRLRQDLLMVDLVPSLHLAYPLPCWNKNMTFSTNKWGMRDKEYSLDKPEDTLRIEIYGASQVMGFGITDGATFEQIVEDRLNREDACSNHRHFEILNFGVDRYSVMQQLALLDERGFKFSPDIVIFTVRAKEHLWVPEYIAALARYRINVPYEPLMTLLRGEGLASVDNGSIAVPFQSWRNFAQTIGVSPSMPSGELSSRATRISGAVTHWAWKQFADSSVSRGAMPMVLAVDLVMDETPREMPDRSAIKSAGLSVIDLLNVYPEGERNMLRVSAEDIHPNEAGHRIIADNLYDRLLPVVREKCANGIDHVRR